MPSNAQREISLHVLDTDILVREIGGTDLTRSIEERFKAYVRKTGIPQKKPRILTIKTTTEGQFVEFDGNVCLVNLRSEWPRADDIVKALLVRERPDLLFLHACAVEKSGQALVAVGSTTSGKTTLSQELSRRGFRILSDDLVPIHVESGQVYPLRTTPAVRQLRTSGESAAIETGNQPRSDPVNLRNIIILNLDDSRPEARTTLTCAQGPMDEWHRILKMIVPEVPQTRAKRVHELQLTTTEFFNRPPTLRTAKLSETIQICARLRHPPSRGVGDSISELCKLVGRADSYVLNSGILDSTVSLIEDLYRGIEGC